MALPNSYNVFLETFNRGAGLKMAAPASPAQSNGLNAGLSEETLRPVLTSLAKQADAMDVARLAIDANVKLTPLVNTLQHLNQAGLVEYNQNQDLVKLTDIGRQVLAVGKSM